MHALYTGEIPVVSGFLFVLVSSVYAMVLGLVNRYEVVYAFQHELIQGFLASLAAGSRFVVGLQSVPVRQYYDFKRVRNERSSMKYRIAVVTYGLYAMLTRQLLESASAVTCLTEDIRRLTEEVHEVNLSQAHVIGMGIDFDRFEGDVGKRPDAGNTWTIAYVGSVSTTRGIDDLIKVIADIEYDVELRIAGTGTDDQLHHLQQLAREMGVTDRIQWHGLLPHDEVAELLQTSDIAVSPLSDIESFRVSFPAKLLEYMAAGCLVVASDLPAHRRVITDGTNGFLYDGGKAQLQAALRTCIESKDRHDAIRRAAMETAAEYNWETIVDSHEQVMFQCGSQ